MLFAPLTLLFPYHRILRIPTYGCRLQHNAYNCRRNSEWKRKRTFSERLYISFLPSKYVHISDPLHIFWKHVRTFLKKEKETNNTLSVLISSIFLTFFSTYSQTRPWGKRKKGKIRRGEKSSGEQLKKSVYTMRKVIIMVRWIHGYITEVRFSIHHVVLPRSHLVGEHRRAASAE